MKDETRERLLLPLAIPLGSFVVIALVTIGFSRILLNVPHQVATAIAIAMAANILIVCGVVAARKKFTQGQFLALTGATIMPLVVGGAVAAGILDVAGGDHAAAEERVRAEIAAANITFTPTELEVEAGKRITLRFANNDTGIPHNVAIFAGADATAPNIFRGDVFPGVATVDYDVPALEKGDYFLHCDVHPNMTGILKVLDQAPSAEPAESPAVSPPPDQASPQTARGEVTARNIAFEPKSMEFSGGVPILLDFHNEDAGIPHNVAIFRGTRATGQPVFRGDVFSGVRSMGYRVPALQPGDYFFHCDVHPNMIGTIKVT